MPFYTYAYVEQMTRSSHWFLYGFSALLLIAGLVVGVKYLHHRMETRYRDMGIIIILCVLLLMGIQGSDYLRSRETMRENSQMADFLQSVSSTWNVPVQQIRVNRVQPENGMLLQIQNTFYKVTFLRDSNAYQLEPVYLIHPQIRVIDKED